MRWCRWVAFVLGCVTLAQAAPAAKPMAQQRDVDKLRAQVEELRKANKPADAVAACETFLTAHPDEGWFTNDAIELVRQITFKEYADWMERRQLLQHSVDAPADSTLYYTWAATELGISYLYPPDGKNRDVAVAEKLLATAADKVKGKIPPWFSPYGPMLSHLGNARRELGKLDEAEAGLKAAVLEAPRIFTVPEFAMVLFDIAKARRDVPAMLSAAKLGYVVCDFTEADLKRAIDRCSAALTVKGGPGLGLAFARCQDDAKLDNPLREAKLPDLGDPAAILTAAGKDLPGRVNALLYAGQLKTLLDLAQDELFAAAGTDQGRLTEAMKLLARCFKAKDLSLQRANRLLDYHRTGEGKDPLVELEAELKAP